jgi:acetyltransferase-like isoleucine patch superfamily enzyme
VRKLTRAGIDAAASVEKQSLLGPNTRLRAGARLTGYVKTGKNSLIDFNAIILGPVSIGSGTYIGPNCVVGYPTSRELMKSAGSLSSKSKTTIGKNCIIRSGTTIYSAVKIGDDVSFGHNVLVRENVTVGNRTILGTNVAIDGTSTIGSNVSMQTGVYLCTYSTVEDSVFLGPCCVFTNDKYMYQKKFKLIGPTVRRGASIGANSLLFPGITVGERAVVGSQAMVNQDVPPRTIYVGLPARKMRAVPNSWCSSLLRS